MRNQILKYAPLGRVWISFTHETHINKILELGELLLQYFNTPLSDWYGDYTVIVGRNFVECHQIYGQTVRKQQWYYDPTGAKFQRMDQLAYLITQRLNAADEFKRLIAIQEQEKAAQQAKEAEAQQQQKAQRQAQIAAQQEAARQAAARAEAARQAEAQRQREAETARQAELQRQAQIAAQQEAARIAELERQRAEAARQAEAQRQREAETAKQAAQAQRIQQEKAAAQLAAQHQVQMEILPSPRIAGNRAVLLPSQQQPEMKQEQGQDAHADAADQNERQAEDLFQELARQNPHLHL